MARFPGSHRSSVPLATLAVLISLASLCCAEDDEVAVAPKERKESKDNKEAKERKERNERKEPKFDAKDPKADIVWTERVVPGPAVSGPSVSSPDRR
jgi:hypothetical protein